MFEEFDVVIVGGGMVGASLALALSRGTSVGRLRVALLDNRNLDPSPLTPESSWQPRVSAINEASRQFFCHLGVWENIVEQRVCPFQDMKVWDGEGTGVVEFNAREFGFDNIGHIIENDVIRNGLLTGLADSGVALFCEEESPEITLQQATGHQIKLADDSIITAPLLVGADGAESMLRRLAGIPSNQKDYRHHALITAVETSQPHRHCAKQIFLDTGPLAFLPLPDQNGKHYCSIVWSLLPAEADRIQSLSDEAFCKELERCFEFNAGQIISASPRIRFPLRERHARQYHRQAVAIVGDAAHTIHPLAGQGVNLGFMDARVLAEELLRAHRRGDNLAGTHILDRYQRRRMTENRLMQKAMLGFQELFNSNEIAIRWLRNTGMKVTQKMPLVKEAFMYCALGLNGKNPELEHS